MTLLGLAVLGFLVSLARRPHLVDEGRVVIAAPRVYVTADEPVRAARMVRRAARQQTTPSGVRPGADAGGNSGRQDRPGDHR